MKTQEELKELASGLTKFKSCECSCKSCQGLCEAAPCMATPQEIKALIDAGHIDDLAPTTHWATLLFGLPPLDCVMIKARDEGGCSLFKNGKCALHTKGLKPSEGRFANHNPNEQSFPHIVATWMIEENAPLVEWIMAQFPPLPPLDGEDNEFMSNLAIMANVLFKSGADTGALNNAIAKTITDYMDRKTLRKAMIEVTRELIDELGLESDAAV